MAFFPKADPLKSAERDLDVATVARDKLRARLLDAEAAISAATAAARTLALDAADDAALDKAESKLRAAQDRATTLRAALDQSNPQISALEQSLAAAADKQTRAATVVEINTMVVEFKTVGQELAVVIAKMAGIAERTGAFIPESKGLHAFCASSVTQIPDAVALILKLLGNHADAVVAGTAPATLRRPEAPYVEKPVLPAPTQIVFCLRSVKWRDAEGKQQLAGKFTDAYLPPQLVAKALKSGACVAISDPRRKQFHHTQNEQPRADLALDLDADPDHAPQAEPIMASSPFTVVDRGPPTQMKVLR